MIDPRELRIGNYVEIESVEIPKMDIKTEPYMQISSEGISQLSRGIGDCNPIPITEEWLKKFGFEKGQVTSPIEAYAWCKFSFFLSIRSDGFLYEWIGGNITIKHVHQLQNAYFSLTGEELKITEE